MLFKKFNFVLREVVYNAAAVVCSKSCISRSVYLKDNLTVSLKKYNKSTNGHLTRQDLAFLLPCKVGVLLKLEESGD